MLAVVYVCKTENADAVCVVNLLLHEPSTSLKHSCHLHSTHKQAAINRLSPVYTHRCVGWNVHRQNILSAKMLLFPAVHIKFCFLRQQMQTNSCFVWCDAILQKQKRDSTCIKPRVRQRNVRGAYHQLSPVSIHVQFLFIHFVIISLTADPKNWV